MEKWQTYSMRVFIVGMWLLIIGGIFWIVSNEWLFRSPRSIAVFCWGDTFDEAYVEQFERETGIRVMLSYYSTNEELLSKLRSTGGSGYDLVVPSDYTVSKLREEGLIKKIDRSQITFFSALNPVLLGHSFDPHNEYTLPFEWELYVVGINTRFIEKSVFNPWDAIFRPGTVFNGKHRITMVNDAVEAICMASRYLFGDVTELNDEQQEAVKRLLIEQKPWVEAYTSIRPDYYLVTDQCTLSLSQNAPIWLSMRSYKNIDFTVPDETFVTIENCAIPIGSKKDALVYQFLNYIFSKESCIEHFVAYGINPARLDVVDELPASDQQKAIIRSSSHAFSRYHFFRDLMPEQQKHNLWIAVKS